MNKVAGPSVTNIAGKILTVNIDSISSKRKIIVVETALLKST